MSSVVKLSVLHLHGVSKYGAKIMEPLYYTLKFPDIVMPKSMHDVLMNYIRPLAVSEQVHWTHVLHHTTYLGDFSETTDYGKFIYTRDFDQLK